VKTELYRVIRRPIITEKGMAVKESQHTVVFEVAPEATKTEIKQAVQMLFKVKVEAVRTAIYHGKFRRRGRSAGHRRDWKKAYVKLKPNEKMIEYADNL
jgi:large subunit ribosomal protein L23